MDAYYFFIEFVLLTFPVILSVMMLSYGLCSEFKRVTPYNLLVNCVLTSFVVHYMVVFFVDVQMHLLAVFLITTIVFKISSDSKIMSSIKCVVMSSFINLMIQFLVGILLLFMFKTNFDVLKSGGGYSILGTVSSSVITFLIGAKVYLIQLNKKEKENG